jgi:transglutaminase-like putative cysteine protease
MAKEARKGSEDIVIRTLAMDLTRHLQQKDYGAEACELLKYCRDNIRYVRDTRTVEVIQVPRRTLHLGAGDCDDKSVLLGAMLASLGHDVRFIAIALVPGHFSHVWTQTRIRGKWLDLEATEPLQCGERVPESPGARYMTESLS